MRGETSEIPSLRVAVAAIQLRGEDSVATAKIPSAEGVTSLKKSVGNDWGDSVVAATVF
jgi:hypothetical protein